MVNDYVKDIQGHLHPEILLFYKHCIPYDPNWKALDEYENSEEYSSDDGAGDPDGLSDDDDYAHRRLVVSLRRWRTSQLSIELKRLSAGTASLARR